MLSWALRSRRSVIRVEEGAAVGAAVAVAERLLRSLPSLQRQLLRLPLLLAQPMKPTQLKTPTAVTAAQALAAALDLETAAARRAAKIPNPVLPSRSPVVEKQRASAQHTGQSATQPRSGHTPTLRQPIAYAVNEFTALSIPKVPRIFTLV